MDSARVHSGDVETSVRKLRSFLTDLMGQAESTAPAICLRIQKTRLRLYEATEQAEQARSARADGCTGTVASAMSIFSRILAGAWAGAVLALLWLLTRIAYVKPDPIEGDGFMLSVMGGAAAIGAVLGLLSGAHVSRDE